MKVFEGIIDIVIKRGFAFSEKVKVKINSWVDKEWINKNDNKVNDESCCSR